MGFWCWRPSSCSGWSYSRTSTGGMQTMLDWRSWRQSCRYQPTVTSSQSASGCPSCSGSTRWWRGLSNWLNAKLNRGQQHHLRRENWLQMEIRKSFRITLFAKPIWCRNLLPSHTSPHAKLFRWLGSSFRNECCSVWFSLKSYKQSTIIYKL